MEEGPLFLSVFPLSPPSVRLQALPGDVPTVLVSKGRQDSVTHSSRVSPVPRGPATLRGLFVRAAPQTLLPPPLPDYKVFLRRKGDGAVSAGYRGQPGHLSAHILFPSLRRLAWGRLFPFGFSRCGSH